MNRPEKEQVVQSLNKKFEDSVAVFMTEYRGLKVAEMTALRRELNEVQTELKVSKNRLV